MIQLNHVHFAYTRKKPLFTDLSLTIEPGSIVGLLGKNGAGKSSLLKLMAGLIYPQKGTCHIMSQSSQLRHPDVLSRLFIIPEEFRLPPISIGKFISLNAPFYPCFDETWFAEQLQAFSIDTQKRLDKLSFGQRKKFLIAYGLATRTELLILDEPTNGLDIPSKRIFRKMVAATMDENRTILISTHQVRDVENLIDRIVVLDEGRIVFEQPMDRVSRCLEVAHTAHLPEDALHHEKEISGFSVLRKNETGIDAAVDLEFLFGATLANPESLQTCFQEEALS